MKICSKFCSVLNVISLLTSWQKVPVDKKSRSTPEYIFSIPSWQKVQKPPRYKYVYTYGCAIRCHMGKALVRCVTSATNCIPFAFRTHHSFYRTTSLQPQLQLLVVGCGMHQTRFLTISGEGWLVKKAEKILWVLLQIMCYKLCATNYVIIVSSVINYF